MSKPEPERILLTVREGIDADNLRTEILSDWGEAVTGARLVTLDDALCERMRVAELEAISRGNRSRHGPRKAALRVAFGEEG